jgi:hypothetical protein
MEIYLLIVLLYNILIINRQQQGGKGIFFL